MTPPTTRIVLRIQWRLRAGRELAFFFAGFCWLTGIL
jgi:hypothetical protein